MTINASGRPPIYVSCSFIFIPRARLKARMDAAMISLEKENCNKMRYIFTIILDCHVTTISSHTLLLPSPADEKWTTDDETRRESTRDPPAAAAAGGEGGKVGFGSRVSRAALAVYTRSTTTDDDAGQGFPDFHSIKRVRVHYTCVQQRVECVKSVLCSKTQNV